MQQALSNNLAATHQLCRQPVSPPHPLWRAKHCPRACLSPGTSTQQFQPFPDLGGIGQIHYAGVSTYNSLQAKLEKRYSHGLSFLATYTWAHALDDSSDAAGNFTGINDRNLALIPFIDEFTNSVFDIRTASPSTATTSCPSAKARRSCIIHVWWMRPLAAGRPVLPSRHRPARRSPSLPTTARRRMAAPALRHRARSIQRRRHAGSFQSGCDLSVKAKPRQLV